MAALQQELSLVAVEKSDRTRKQKHFRLVADPSIAVSRIESTLQGYMDHCESKVLWNLVCPPASGPSVVSWQRQPNPEWLVKTMGLLFDMVIIAPNTKLQGAKVLWLKCSFNFFCVYVIFTSKIKISNIQKKNNNISLWVKFWPKVVWGNFALVEVTKALRSLYHNRRMNIPPGMLLDETVDQIDLCLRVLLSMIRSMKMSKVASERVFRNLSKNEQTGLELVLKKVALPVEMLSGEPFILEDEATSVGMEFTMNPKPKWAEPLAIMDGEIKHTSASTTQHPKEPSQSSPRQAGQGLQPLHGIFSKINQGLFQIKDSSQEEGSKTYEGSSQLKGSQKNDKESSQKKAIPPEIPLDDDMDLLQSAASFAPKNTENKQKPFKNKNKKTADAVKKEKKHNVKDSKKGKLTAKDCEGKKSHDKEVQAESKKERCSSGNEGKGSKVRKASTVKESKQTGTTKATKGVKVNHELDAQDVDGLLAQILEEGQPENPEISNAVFECPTYGECKMEAYTNKSYIRHKIDGKWTNIIGSCKPGRHQWICHNLVPFVKAGKDKNALYEIREKLMNSAMDV